MRRQKGVKNPGGKLSGPLAQRSEVLPSQNFENLTHRFWSHAGQKHHLVTQWSKRPIHNFRL